jgi:hypothetical protein
MSKAVEQNTIPCYYPDFLIYRASCEMVKVSAHHSVSKT